VTSDSTTSEVYGGGTWVDGRPSVMLYGDHNGYGIYKLVSPLRDEEFFGHREAVAAFVADARQIAENLHAGTWQPELCRAWLLAMAADADARLRRLELGSAIRMDWDGVTGGRKVSALAEALGVHRDTVYAVANGEAWI
jgi:hypothetical protein